MKSSQQITTKRKVETPAEPSMVTLTTEVPEYVRNRIDMERLAQKRPSRSNMASVILQEWADSQEGA